MAPRVSVLLPIRQWRASSAAAVQSVLDQTFEDFELLLIGDSGIDALRDRLPADSRIKCVVREKPGIVSALNTGLGVAAGKYIARMDDDDLAYASRFEIQLRYLETHKDIGFCGARIRFIDQHGLSDGVGQGNRRYEDWLNGLTTSEAISDNCFIECALPHPTWMAPRTTFDLLDGYREFDGPEDFDFVLRAWLAGVRMGKPDEVLLDWRVHESRLTLTDSRYRREAFTVTRAIAACRNQSGLSLDTGRAIWICGTGRNARYWFDALLAQGCNVSGFVDLDRPGAAQRKRHRPVITYEELWRRRHDELVVTAITDPIARGKLIETFTARGWIANHDYLLGG